MGKICVEIPAAGCRCSAVLRAGEICGGLVLPAGYGALGG